VIAVLVALATGLIFKQASAPSASCGSVVNGPSYHPEPVECLWRAYQDHRVAGAVMTNITIEGDPIAYSVEISTSTISLRIQSDDRFGQRGLYAYRCTGLARAPSVNGSGRLYLVATGCVGPQGFVDDAGRVTIP
jgi:hypothetical protein